MAEPFMGRCGIDCKACEYRESTNCGGCFAAGGKLFWGECALAACCISKGHDHCGQCQKSPCAALNDYSFDKEHGDNGKRISNLRAWNEKGYDAWRREQNAQ